MSICDSLFIFVHGGSRQGNRDQEGRPSANLAFYRDGARVVLDDLLGNGHSQSEAHALALSEEGLEEGGLQVGGDAGSIVGKPDAGPVLPGVAANAEGASTLERILGIDRDIQESSPEFIRVDGNRGIAVEFLHKAGLVVSEQGSPASRFLWTVI